jgi:hypothetical protein
MARSFLAGFAMAALCWILLPLPGGAVPDRPSRSPWGTVRGRVIWGSKTVPQQKPVRVTKDRDHCLAGGPILTEDYVINPKTKGVRWVLVFLAPAGKKPLRIHPDLLKPFARSIDLTIWCGRFKPHFLALRQGQIVRIHNPGRICYNANWYGTGQAQSGNVLIPPEGTHVVRNLKPERLVIPLRDSIHPWMRAWIKVFDHPYFAVTDADGRFTIPKAPAGTYRLITWQESTGWGPGGKAGVSVTIPGGGETTVSLKLLPVS